MMVFDQGGHLIPLGIVYAPVVPNLIEHTHARSSWHKIGHEIRWEVEQNHFDAIGKPCKGAAWCWWPGLKERKNDIWVQGWMCVWGLWGVWTMLCNICPVPSIPMVSSYLPTFSSTTTKPLHQKTLISAQHTTFHFGLSSFKDWWKNQGWNQNHSLFLLLLFDNSCIVDFSCVKSSDIFGHKYLCSSLREWEVEHSYICDSNLLVQTMLCQDRNLRVGPNTASGVTWFFVVNLWFCPPPK